MLWLLGRIARADLLLVPAVALLLILAAGGCGMPNAGTTRANGKMDGTAYATPLTAIPAMTPTSIVQSFPAPTLPLPTPAIIPNGAPLRVVLQAELASSKQVSTEQLNAAKAIIQRRIALLRVPNARVTVQGANRLMVELPALKDAAATIATLSAPGLLEIIDPAGQYLPVGTVVQTSLGGPIGQATPSTDGIYTTILTGDDLASAFLTEDQLDRPAVGFTIAPKGAAKLSTFTSQNIGWPMSIVVDKRVVNTATIQGTISNQGQITGLSPEAAAALVVKLKSGALPIPLTVVESSATP